MNPKILLACLALIQIQLFMLFFVNHLQTKNLPDLKEEAVMYPSYFLLTEVKDK